MVQPGKSEEVAEILDAGKLLAPISADTPAGLNLREDEDGAAIYYRLKDARASARIAERQADAEAERGPVAAEWRTIFDLAQEVLATRSKDLEVAAWLTEAAIRLHGFPGLRDALAVLEGLVVSYWDSLHSLDADDVSVKVAPLAGLNGVGADGALIQPLRLAPITAPRNGAPAGLWHYMVMRRRGPTCPEGVLLGSAAKGTDTPSFKALHDAIRRSLAHFSGLTALLDTACGADSPPSSTIRNTLIEAADALRDVSGLGPDALAELGDAAEPAQATPSPAAPVAAAPADTQAPPPPAVPVVLHSREDALRELSRIAMFFRENEPNSPTGFTLETLIRRARMPLGDLLQELIPDAAVRRAYLSAAGIQSQDEAGT